MELPFSHSYLFRKVNKWILRFESEELSEVHDTRKMKNLCYKLFFMVYLSSELYVNTLRYWLLTAIQFVIPVLLSFEYWGNVLLKNA